MIYFLIFYKTDKMMTEELREVFLNELKPSDEEHVAEILRVHQNLTNEITSSTEKIPREQLIVNSMNSKSLYETIGYGIIALQSVDSLDFLKDDKEKIKDGIRELLYQKIGVWKKSDENV